MNNQHGFTLVELLIVIAIIGILAAVLVPNLVSARAKANDTAALSYARNCYVTAESKRNMITGALPVAGATACNDPQLVAVPYPASVTAAVLTPNAAGGMSVAATSVTGRVFTYDGNTMTQTN